MRTNSVAIVLLVCGVLLTAGVASSAKEDTPTRSVKGLVTDGAENPIAGAVVQLKNTKTLQVKSFITDKDGSYYFHGLDPNVDYQLNARLGDVVSRTRTVSTFDDRKEVVYNFELKAEK